MKRPPIYMPHMGMQGKPQTLNPKTLNSKPKAGNPEPCKPQSPKRKEAWMPLADVLLGALTQHVPAPQVQWLVIMFVFFFFCCRWFIWKPPCLYRAPTFFQSFVRFGIRPEPRIQTQTQRPLCQFFSAKVCKAVLNPCECPAKDKPNTNHSTKRGHHTEWTVFCVTQADL